MFQAWPYKVQHKWFWQRNKAGSQGSQIISLLKDCTRSRKGITIDIRAMEADASHEIYTFNKGSIGSPRP